eukprot:SAG31_NODE_1295_length_8952_cov_8.332957_3_plen_45_part_00
MGLRDEQHARVLGSMPVCRLAGVDWRTLSSQMHYATRNPTLHDR